MKTLEEIVKPYDHLQAEKIEELIRELEERHRRRMAALKECPPSSWAEARQIREEVERTRETWRAMKLALRLR
jgi:hypothetical protein